MVSSVPPKTSTSYDGPASPDGDWPTQLADAIEQVVGTVRDKTTGPALTVAKALVYGTFAALIGLAAVVVFAIAAVRLLDSYLPDAVFGESHTWAAHLILGLLLVIAGGVLWLRRRAPEQTSR
jgi:hypothetical protein